MAKTPRELISETKSSMSLIESELEEFVQTRNELNRQLANARRKLDRKKSDTYPNKLSRAILTSLKKEAPTILMQSIKKAADTTEEFKNSVYIYYMNLAAQDESIYKFIVSGSGWEQILSPQIVYEESAGNTQDYIRGILRYRALLKVKEGNADSNRGLKATNWWLRHIYGTERQDDTIDKRVANSGKTAPFWQLLNSGSVNVPSLRDDGSFNPFPQQPTGFIDDAQDVLKKEFNDRFYKEGERWNLEAKDLGLFIQDIEDRRDRVSATIKNLRTESKQNRAIFNSFGDLKQFVSQEKLDKALRRYRAGEEFERVLISFAGSRRVYLTAQRVQGLLD